MSFFVHPTAVVDEPCQIGVGTRVWHFCHLMAGCQIGKECILGQNVFVASGVVLGDRVKVQNNVSLYEGVVCEDDVFLGPSMVFTNVLNPRSFVNRKSEFKVLVVGNPARQIGWVSALGHTLSFDEQGRATCPESGKQYKLKDNQVVEL